MYIPKPFEETDIGVLHQLIEAHPLGALVTMTGGGLDANHVPFLVHSGSGPRDPGSERRVQSPESRLPAYGTLHGHIARANPLWRELVPDVDVLVIFQGPERFISPSLYPTKRATGKVVPTWNYVVVHAHGPLRFIDDAVWMRAHVEALTNHHEAPRDEPWKVTDAPADYVDRMVGALIGLEIQVTRLVGKWKVSQNRPPEDRQGVIDGLLREGSEAATEVADLVRTAHTRSSA